MSATRSITVGQFTLREHIRDGEKSGSWQLDVPPHLSPTGRRQRKSFSTRRLAEAEAKALTREIQLRGRFANASIPCGITFEEIAKEWLTNQRARRDTEKKRQASLTTNAYRLKPLLAYFGTLDGNLIHSDRVVDYQKERLSKRKPPTINSETATLQQVLHWAKNRRLIDNLPSVETIPYHKPRLDLPSVEEVAQILTCLPNKTTRLIVRVFAETGLRKGELFSLRWRDVDYKNMKLVVARSGEFTPKTTHSARDVFVSQDLITEIMALPRKSELVFPGRGGGKLWSVGKALRKAILGAGVVRDGEPMKLTLHMLRKAHATWQAESGTIQPVLQARLGHAPGSRVTQQVYIHATEAAQKRAAFQLPKSE